MSEFKGTPGPWVVEEREFVMDRDGNCVGAFGGMKATDEDNANATLCAAAPELLEALQSLKRELVLSDVDLAYIESHFRPHIDRARAAIARALGQ